MAETQKKSVEEYLIEVCQGLVFLWGPIIRVRYLQTENTHYILVGPDSIYRDSEIFVKYQHDLLETFKKFWPGETLEVRKFEAIPNTRIIHYDNTCTTLES